MEEIYYIKIGTKFFKILNYYESNNALNIFQIMYNSSGCNLRLFNIVDKENIPL